MCKYGKVRKWCQLNSPFPEFNRDKSVWNRQECRIDHWSEADVEVGTNFDENDSANRMVLLNVVRSSNKSLGKVYREDHVVKWASMGKMAWWKMTKWVKKSDRHEVWFISKIVTSIWGLNWTRNVICCWPKRPKRNFVVRKSRFCQNEAALCFNPFYSHLSVYPKDKRKIDPIQWEHWGGW